MIVIGSRALIYRIGLNIGREPKDIDLICTLEEFQALAQRHRGNIFKSYPTSQGKKMILHLNNDCIFECELAWADSTAGKLVELTEADLRTTEAYFNEVGLVKVPSLDVLYALKRSHRFLKNSPHFLKTMLDLKRMEQFRAHVEPMYAEWLKEREKETYTYSHPKLNVNKASFFNPEQVTYTYDHDSIHECMAWPNPPAYTLFKDDQAEVRCSKEKFFSISEEDRLRSVREESEVLALERSQVPFPGKLTPRQSFLKALEKVCTSISSGWWREYAYDNYYKVVESYREDYLTIFKTGVTTGVVKPFDASKPTLY